MRREVLRQRPFLTGLLLGLVVWVAGNSYAAGTGTVALLFFGTGVVLAVFGEADVQLAGQTLASAGATVLILPIVFVVARALLDEIAPATF